MKLITGNVSSTKIHKVVTLQLEGNTQGQQADLIGLEYHDVATLYALMNQDEHGKMKELITNLLLTFK
jgi:hypothetical protein